MLRLERRSAEAACAAKFERTMAVDLIPVFGGDGGVVALHRQPEHVEGLKAPPPPKMRQELLAHARLYFLCRDCCL